MSGYDFYTSNVFGNDLFPCVIPIDLNGFGSPFVSNELNNLLAQNLQGFNPFPLSNSNSVVHVDPFSGLGGSAPTQSSPNIPTNYVPNFQVGIADYMGGAAASGVLLLERLAMQSNQAAVAAYPQVMQTLSVAEWQFFEHTIGAPNIAASMIQFGQIWHSWTQGDMQGVYSNAANAFGGMAGGAIAQWGATALRVGPVSMVAAVGIAQVAAGALAALGAVIAYDYVTGKITEHDADRVLQNFRNDLEQFYQQNPFARGDR